MPEVHSFGAEAWDLSVFWSGLCVWAPKALNAMLTSLSPRISVHMRDLPFCQMQLHVN